MNNLGERLYSLRTSNEMSQGDLAEKLNVSRQTISKWENNMSIPELDKIIALSNVFGVSVDYIVKGEGELPVAEAVDDSEAECEAISESVPVRMITKNPTKNLIAGLSIGLGAFYLITLLVNSVSLISNILSGYASTAVVTIAASLVLSCFTCIALLSRKLNLLAVSYILMALYAVVIDVAYGDTSNIVISVLNIIDYASIAVLYFVGNKKNAKALLVTSVVLLVAASVSEVAAYAVNFMEVYEMTVANAIYSSFSTVIGQIPYLIIHIGSAYLMYLRANPKLTYEVPETEHSEMYVGIVGHILLTLFTLGIYDCIWVYKTTENLNKSGVNEAQSGAKKLLLCIFIPFYRIYWFYAQAKRLENLMRAKDMHTADFAVITLILAIFIPVVAASAFLQVKINEYSKN